MINKKIKGHGGGGKGGGGKARTPVESPDSLQSIQYANVIDLISEGETEGLVDGLKSIFFDDVPVQNPDGTYNFKNVFVEYRNGTQGQTPIKGFSNSQAEKPVSVEVKNGIPVTRTITNPETDSARVTISVPRLTFQSLTTGDTTGTSVMIQIAVQSNGGGYVLQPLRQTFQNIFTATSGIFTAQAAASRFQFVVRWTPETIRAPQTCQYKLQYREVGDTTWLDYETHTFSGGSFQSSFSLLSVAPFGFSNQQETQTKTFDVILASAVYQFRVLKVNGSRAKPQNNLGFILSSIASPQSPFTGTAYGGTVAIITSVAYTPTLNDVISGKTTSKYQRAYNIDLDGDAPWDIRVIRVTANSNQSNLQNQTFWDSYTEIIDDNFSYPNCMIVATQIDAEQFSRIPTRRFNIKGIKVQIPNNYDPLQRSYDGTWDGGFVTAWTNNPAWIFYDLATNSRYGLGDFISSEEIDKWRIYTIAQYCDVMVPDGQGGVEPRFTCNCFLQTREQAYQVMMNLASSFRAVVYWGNDEIILSQDTPKDAVQLFSPANVIDGNFNYSGSSSKVRHNVVLVTWNDPSDAFNQKVEYVSDDSSIAIHGVVQTEVTAFGCLSRGQANRFGKAIIYSEKNETEIVSFRAGIANIYAQGGDIIKINDPNRAGVRHGGRVVSATVDEITIDREISIEVGEDYEVSVVLPDGTIETREVLSAVGLRNVLILSSSLSQVPQSFAMWIVSSTSVEAEQWRIVTVSEIDKTNVDITALSYNPNKFDFIENDIEFQPPSVSLINVNRPAKPSGFTAEESLYLSGLGVVATGLTVSWQSSIDAKSYVFVYRKDDENQITITTERTSIELRPIEDGNYSFNLVAINHLGKESEPLIINQTVYGKTAPPNDVQNFSVSPLGAFGIFSWDTSIDLDVLVGGKVVFRYSPSLSSTWETAGPIDSSAGGNANTVTLPLQDGKYFAKFQDSSGNISVNAATLSANVVSVLQLNLAETLDENSWSETKTDTEYDVSLTGLILSSDSDGVLPYGEYYIGQIDLGSVLTSRYTSFVESYGIDSNDLWDSDELMDSTELMDGSEVTGVSAKIYYRLTDDDPSGSPVWTDYFGSVVADVSSRAVDCKLVLTSDSVEKNILVKSLDITVDMPERVQGDNDITSGTSTYNVVYPTEFYISPAVGVTIHNMQTGDYYTVTNKTATGFDIDFYNSSAVQVSRDFDYIAKGY